MEEPVADSTADGVEPLAALVAGHGSSSHVGRFQVLSGLQVAVADVE